MNDEPITEEKFKEIVDSLDKEERDYFRECVEEMVRCFMPDSETLGVFVVANRTGYGAKVYAMNADSIEVKIMLESVLFNKFADEAAMKIPKEKLN
jgi:hypothetical protein